MKIESWSPWNNGQKNHYRVSCYLSFCLVCLTKPDSESLFSPCFRLTVYSLLSLRWWWWGALGISRQSFRFLFFLTCSWGAWNEVKMMVRWARGRIRVLTRDSGCLLISKSSLDTETDAGLQLKSYDKWSPKKMQVEMFLFLPYSSYSSVNSSYLYNISHSIRHKSGLKKAGE